MISQTRDLAIVDEHWSYNNTHRARLESLKPRHPWNQAHAEASSLSDQKLHLAGHGSSWFAVQTLMCIHALCGPRPCVVAASRCGQHGVRPLAWMNAKGIGWPPGSITPPRGSHLPWFGSQKCQTMPKGAALPGATTNCGSTAQSQRHSWHWFEDEKRQNRYSRTELCHRHPSLWSSAKHSFSRYHSFPL